MANKYKQPYHKAVDEAYEIFKAKNAEYGDAIQETGVLGAIVTLVGDVARLREMAIKQDLEDNIPQIEDKLLDALNYCVIATMLLQQGNLRGK